MDPSTCYRSLDCSYPPHSWQNKRQFCNTHSKNSTSVHTPIP